MSLSEAAVAIGLLTPLILGILAFIEKFARRKKGPEEAEPKVVTGMTVAVGNPYADDLIKELRSDRDKADQKAAFYKRENELLRARLQGKEDL